MGSGGVPRGGEGVPPISHRDLQPPDTGTGGSLRSRRPRALGVTGVSGVTGRWQRSGGWDRGHAHPAPRWPLAPASPRTRPEPGGGGGEGGLGQPDAACPPQTPGCPLLGGGGCLPWPPPPYPDHPQELGAVGGSTGTDLVVHGPPTRRRHVPPPFASAGQRSLFPACTRMGDPGACPPPCPPPEGNQVSRCPPPPRHIIQVLLNLFPFIDTF